MTETERIEQGHQELPGERRTFVKRQFEGEPKHRARECKFMVEDVERAAKVYGEVTRIFVTVTKEAVYCEAFYLPGPGFVPESFDHYREAIGNG